MNIVVTGAASGIGRAVCQGLVQAEFAGTGTKLLLVDRTEAREPLERLGSELNTSGLEARIFTGDLADPDIPGAAIEAAAGFFDGGIDALVSNAGIIARGELKDIALATYEADFAVNARATWLLGKSAYPLLKEAQGCIVATASLSAFHPTTPLGAYSASKAAVVMLVRQMALDWGPDGIRCNTVSPGPTITGMSAPMYDNPQTRARREASLPLRRLNEAKDVANAILFLVSPKARNITGVDLPVDCGLSISLMASSGTGTLR